LEAFIEFVKNWGYLAVFLGALVEGESIILTASSLAFFGYLDIYKVATIAFFATVFADQSLYHVGRHYGVSFFDKYPRFKPASDRAFKLLHRFDIWFILSFRFIYGIRTISPVVIGASGVAIKRYTVLNLIAALIWTVVSCWGGYSLGEAMMKILENIHLIQKYFIGFIVIVMLLILCFSIWKKKKSKI
jgi:membrane protein DedA with SNARE-associated domain